MDEAGEYFQKAIDVSKSSYAPSLFGLSMILYRRGEYAQAETLIRQGLSASPNSAAGKYCLGLLQCASGRIADAQRSTLDAMPRSNARRGIPLAHIHEHHDDPYGLLAEVQIYVKLFPHGELQDDVVALRERAQQNLRLSVSSN
jgi:tetratricopeptide (TPR) repeat protein